MPSKTPDGPSSGYIGTERRLCDNELFTSHCRFGEAYRMRTASPGGRPRSPDSTREPESCVGHPFPRYGLHGGGRDAGVEKVQIPYAVSKSAKSTPSPFAPQTCPRSASNEAGRHQEGHEQGRGGLASGRYPREHAATSMTVQVRGARWKCVATTEFRTANPLSLIHI